MPERVIQSVDRALQILEFLALHPEGVSLSDVSSSLRLPRPTTHHLLSTLRQRGFVVQDTRYGRYRCGTKLTVLATASWRGVDLLGESRPVMLEFTYRTGEVVTLCILEHERVLILDRISPNQLLPSLLDTGRSAPAYCTAAGKVLIAYLPQSIADHLLSTCDRQRWTPNTVIDPEELHEQFASIRRTGLGIDREEWKDGLFCIASPIFDFSGHAVAALSCSMATTRIDTDKLRGCERALKHACQAISQRLGYAGRPVTEFEPVFGSPPADATVLARVPAPHHPGALD